MAGSGKEIEQRFHDVNAQIEFALCEIATIPDLIESKFIEHVELGLGHHAIDGVQSLRAPDLASYWMPIKAPAVKEITDWDGYLKEAKRVSKKIDALKLAMKLPQKPMESPEGVIQPPVLDPDRTTRKKARKALDKAKELLDAATKKFEDLEFSEAKAKLREAKAKIRDDADIKKMTKKLKKGRLYVSAIIEIQMMIKFLDELII